MAQMPTPAIRLGAIAALIGSLLLSAGVASAATTGADLRVVAPGNRTLAEFRQYTGTVDVATDPGANCFGQGTGGSGDRVRVPGATALGAVRDALETDLDLRPLSVTDAFVDQGFGLGVCGIGGFETQGSSFWYVKRNHVGSQVSGSQLPVSLGDDLLWYLSPSFPPPAELSLVGPPRARPNVPFRVTVFAYADDGSRSPAAGARVTGAAQPTDAAGHTTVTSSAGTRFLRATRAQNIPSNQVKVCVNATLSACPATHGLRIVGSNRADRIGGTAGWDSISGRGGPDVINLSAGGRDGVGCGAGRDRVIVKAGDQDDNIGPTCEQVVTT
jgi:hypothetical protein